MSHDLWTVQTKFSEGKSITNNRTLSVTETKNMVYLEIFRYGYCYLHCAATAHTDHMLWTYTVCIVKGCTLTKHTLREPWERRRASAHHDTHVRNLYVSTVHFSGMRCVFFCMSIALDVKSDLILFCFSTSYTMGHTTVKCITTKWWMKKTPQGRKFLKKSHHS